jgi:hypothetical protein
MSIIFEISAGLLFYIHMQELHSAGTPKTQNNVVHEIINPVHENKKVIKLKRPQTLTPSIVHENKKESIGFKYDKDNFVHDDVVKYLNYMYDTAKDNYSVGFRKISNALKMGEEKGRKVKGFLETIDVLKSSGVRTQILCTKSEALNKL